MPLISHGGGRRYVIALSGKSLNNSHPTAALATKLGRRYIVSFPRLVSRFYLIVETSSRTMHRVHPSSFYSIYPISLSKFLDSKDLFIYLIFVEQSING